MRCWTLAAVSVAVLVIVTLFAGATRTCGWLDLVGVLIGFALLLVAGYAMIVTDFGSLRLRDVIPRRLFAIGAVFLLSMVAAPIAMALNGGTPKRNLTFLAFINAVLLGASVFLTFVQRSFKKEGGGVEQLAADVPGPHEEADRNHETDAIEC
jgi:hypothetical protein